MVTILFSGDLVLQTSSRPLCKQRNIYCIDQTTYETFPLEQNIYTVYPHCAKYNDTLLCHKVYVII